MSIDLTLNRLWRELSPSTRGSYREAWRRWNEWCGSVSVDPLHANQQQAQGWVDSQRNAGIAATTITRRVRGVTACLEYLAMLGHRPYEPFSLVVLPASVKRGPRPTHARHEPLSTERIARALYQSRLDDRPHCLLWACAGMGLSSSDLADMRAERIRRVGDTSVALIRWGERAHLIPVPREVMLVVEARGWPVNSRNPESMRELIKRSVGPYLGTSAQELRRWHQQTAVALGVDPDRTERDDESRMRWSSHPSLVVCAHLRDALIAVAS